MISQNKRSNQTFNSNQITGFRYIKGSKAGDPKFSPFTGSHYICIILQEARYRVRGQPEYTPPLLCSKHSSDLVGLKVS